MGWRYRRSVKILPGVKLNFSKKGTGVTIGGKYSHVTYGADGRITRGHSIPGTGLSYVEQVRGPQKDNTDVKKRTSLDDINPVLYFFLTTFLGFCGAHRFYRKQIGIGVLYLFTFGVFTIGWIIDLIKALKILIEFVKKRSEDSYNISDADDSKAE